MKLAVGAGLGVYFELPVPGQGQIREQTPQQAQAQASGLRFVFDPALVLVDPQGVVRGRWRVTDPGVSAGRLFTQMASVIREAQATGVQRWVYEGAHLFLCRP